MKDLDQETIDRLTETIKNHDNVLLCGVSKENDESVIHALGNNIETCIDRVIEHLIDYVYEKTNDEFKTVVIVGTRVSEMLEKKFEYGN